MGIKDLTFSYRYASYTNTKKEKAIESLGLRLKKLRKSRKLTLKQLSEKIDCTPGYISQIEKNVTNPSIATLKKLAVALDVKLVDFFINESEDNDYIVTKNGNGFKIQYPQGDASIHLLVRNLSGKLMEPLLARFEPGSGSNGLYAHKGGQEFGYVISGEIDLMVESEVYKLKKGDSFYFDSTKPHGYVNNGKGIAEVMWVISPPTY